MRVRHTRRQGAAHARYRAGDGSVHELPDRVDVQFDDRSRGMRSQPVYDGILKRRVGRLRIPFSRPHATRHPSNAIFGSQFQVFSNGRNAQTSQCGKAEASAEVVQISDDPACSGTLNICPVAQIEQAPMQRFEVGRAHRSYRVRPPPGSARCSNARGACPHMANRVIDGLKRSSLLRRRQVRPRPIRDELGRHLDIIQTCQGDGYAYALDSHRDSLRRYDIEGTPTRAAESIRSFATPGFPAELACLARWFVWTWAARDPQRRAAAA